MNNIGTTLLETPRLSLRRFALGDETPSYKNWTGDDKVTEFLRWQTHGSIDVTRDIINEWIASYSRTDFYQWAVVLKEIDEPIGTISAVDIDNTTEKVHIGYCLGSNWWNRGYMSEALTAVIKFFFEQVGVNRIESQHDPLNVGSGKVMEKCGMTYEGTLRMADISNRGIVDACMHSILASEYFNR